MKDRVAIVTGGTGALGRFIVDKLAGEGLKVYVPSRSIEEFSKVFDSSFTASRDDFKVRKIFSFVCNAIDESSVTEFVAKVSVQENGNIDYLINTVGGIGPSVKVADLSTDELMKSYKLNFISAFYFTRETVKTMVTNNFGRIISIAAKAGIETTPGRFAYSFSKAAVISLMDTVSEEMKQYNIRCNSIIPGIIDTPSNREWGSDEEIMNWVKPLEIAEIIYSLLSDEFSSLRSSQIKLYGPY